MLRTDWLGAAFHNLSFCEAFPQHWHAGAPWESCSGDTGCFASRERDRGGDTIGGAVARQDCSQNALTFYLIRNRLLLEANRNFSPLAATRQGVPGVIFCTLVGTNTIGYVDQLIGVLQQHFAAMPPILARRWRVERSKFGITHATVNRRARTLLASKLQLVPKTVSNLCTPWVTRRNVEPKLPAASLSTITP
jgi:hypothetical protein